MSAQQGWLRSVLDRVVGAEIRESGPRLREWPRPMIGVGVLAYVGMAGCALVALASGPLRSASELVRTDRYGLVPTWGLTVLLGLLTLAVGLLVLAATRTRPLVSGLLGVVLAPLPLSVSRAILSVPAGVATVVVYVVALLACVVLLRRRAFAWWHLPVALAVAVLGVLVPLPALQSTAGSRLAAVDWRGTVLLGHVVDLAVVTFPVLVVAGYAVAEISVRLATWGVERARGSLTRGRWWLLVLVLVAVRAAQVGSDVVTGSAQWTLQRVVPSLLLVALAAGVAWLAASRGDGRDVGPDEAADRISPWLFVVAIALVVNLVLSQAASAVMAAPRALGWVADDTWRAVLTGPLTLTVFRLALAAAALVVAVLRLRAGDRVLPVAAVVLAFLVAEQRLPALADGRAELGVDAATIGLVLTVVALGVLAVRAAQRRLDERTLTSLVTVLAVCALYPAREWLDDPIGMLVGGAGLAATLVGLVWEVLTGRGATDAGGRLEGSPPSRVPGGVLLHLGYLSLSFVILAFAALARSPIGPAAPERWVALGDTFLGLPLLLTVTLTELAAARRAARPAPGSTVAAQDSARVLTTR